MPIHIEELHSDVTVLEGQLPFTPDQLDKLVELVAARVEERRSAERQDRRIPRRSVIPPLDTRG